MLNCLFPNLPQYAFILLGFVTVFLAPVIFIGFWHFHLRRCLADDRLLIGRMRKTRRPRHRVRGRTAPLLPFTGEIPARKAL